MPKSSDEHRIPLASFKWLKYLGIVFVILSLYVVGRCYNHYSDDIFSASLTFVQHIKLSILSIGSMLLELWLPLLFFSGAYIYLSIRNKDISPVYALKRDLLVIVPLGIALWLYGAFGQEPVKRGFFMMIYEIQDLEPGEKLVQDPELANLFMSPDLIGLYNKVDTLDIQIKDAEGRLINHLKSSCSPSQINELFRKVDFESSSIKPKDIDDSKNNWDGVKREIRSLAANARSHLQYIESLKTSQNKARDEITWIHLSPFYILLFLVFGLLLGYLIPLHKAALTAILMAIGFAWYYCTTVLEVTFDPYNSNQSWFVLGKIGFLLLLNTLLLIVAIRVHKRTKEVYL